VQIHREIVLGKQVPVEKMTRCERIESEYGMQLRKDKVDLAPRPGGCLLNVLPDLALGDRQPVHRM
jgi:hypothetical protein